MIRQIACGCACADCGRSESPEPRPRAQAGTAPHATPSATQGGDGTHTTLSGANRHTTADRPLVPHPRYASTTHGGVRA